MILSNGTTGPLLISTIHIFTNKEVEDILPLLGISVMCPAPDKVSAGEVIAFIQRLLTAGVSVGEPVGGSSQIFRKLQFHVESNGIIHSAEKVTDLIVEHGEVKGVRTDRELYETRRVIFAARLPLLFDIVDKVFPQDFVEYRGYRTQLMPEFRLYYQLSSNRHKGKYPGRGYTHMGTVPDKRRPELHPPGEVSLHMGDHAAMEIRWRP